MAVYVAMALISIFIGFLIIYLATILPGKFSDGAAAIESKSIFTFRNITVIFLSLIAAIYLLDKWGFSPLMVVQYIYIASFILIAVIDIEHHLILDVVMVPLFVFALIELFAVRRNQPLYAFGGFAISQFFMMGIYLIGKIFLWVVNSRRAEDDQITEVPFGFGDVTLASFCGLIVGLPYVPLMLFLMIIIGGVIALIFILVRALFIRDTSFQTIPYGPAILIATTIMLLWGDQVMQMFGVVY